MLTPLPKAPGMNWLVDLSSNGPFIYQAVASTNINDSSTDKIKPFPDCCACLRDDVNFLFLPCRHVCVCKNCQSRCEKCPICRSEIFERYEVFITGREETSSMSSSNSSSSSSYTCKNICI